MSDFADRLVAARRSGNALVEDAPPLDLAAGYAVAREIWPTLGSGIGWKIGATNAGAQAFLGIDEPIRGRLFAHSLVADDVTIPGTRPAEAEPEILFHLARDVAPGEDPMNAVDRVAVGVEIVRPSRDDAFALGVGFIVADNAAHVALVIGPDIESALLDTPGEITVRLLLNGEETACGDASAVLGDPRVALRWLATRETLCADDWIASGAIVRACRFAIGDRVEADFGRLGRMIVTRK